MQISEITDLSKIQTLVEAPPRDGVRLARRPGTIPVTARLDPTRYDRLKRLVRRFQTTGQHIIQTSLDRSMMTLERERMPRVEIAGQSTLFAPVIDCGAWIATACPEIG